MDDKQENVPIIKKVKKGHHGHHGGAWKVAYADFVTAMMALFIVLWVLGQSEDIKKAVSNYFKDPTGYSPYGKNVISGSPGSPVPMKNMDGIPKGSKEKEKFEKMKKNIQKELARNKDYVSISGNIEFEIVTEGLRIELVESSDNVFFGIGSSELNSTASRLLHDIGNQLSTLPNKIVVEGHTDSRPFLSGGESYTNFELSADRANSARRALLSGGVKVENIDEIRGYADKRLRDPENPYSLVNRRISIIIKYLE
ncbi:MAG: OmpA family protein [Melioribacteraceae bacterium]|nr:OmpA family protein [Melioribacteraceae bacterium]